MNRAIFLDRDGVLIKNVWRDGKWRGSKDLSECVPIAEKKLLSSLKKQGFRLILVTNQPDIGCGLIKAEAQDAINERLQFMFDLDDAFMCPHKEEDGCACRKPKPGMLLDAAHRHNLDLTACWIIGDRMTDVQAGRAVGCRPILIGGEYPNAPTLTQAVEYVLSR